MYIYALTETDVNGYGENATEYVAFHGALTDGQAEKLNEALAVAKRKSNDEDWETYQIVKYALQVFDEWTGIAGAVVESPIRREFRF